MLQSNEARWYQITDRISYNIVKPIASPSTSQQAQASVSPTVEAETKPTTASPTHIRTNNDYVPDDICTNNNDSYESLSSGSVTRTIKKRVEPSSFVGYDSKSFA